MGEVVLLPFGDRSHWERLLESLAQLVEAGRQQEFVVLLPTRQLLHRGRYKLVARASRQLNLFTFDDIVARTLVGKDRVLVQGAARRQLIGHVLATAAARGELSVLTDYAQSRGVVASVEHVIVELRRAGVVQLEKEPAAPLTKDVLTLAEGYRRLLQQLNATDIEENYFQAAELLPQAKWLAQVQQLFVGWFFDFEPIQLKLLAALANRIKDTTVFLPYHHSQPYPVVERTVSQLTELGFKLCKQVEADSNVALNPLVQDMFVSHASPKPCPGIKGLAAARLEQEVELVAVEIKKQAQQGASPSDFCLVVPDQRRYLPAIRRVFREAAIDISMPLVIDLPAVPWIGELLRLWQAAANPDCQAMARLASSGYIISHLPASADGDAMALALSNVGGNLLGRQILRQVNFEIARLEKLLDGAECWRMQKERRALELYKLALPALEGWIGALEEWFSGELTVSDHCSLVFKLMEENRSRICSQQSGEVALRDKLAWQVMARVMDQFQFCHRLLGTDRLMKPAEFAAALQPWLQQPVTLERASPQAVQVLSPAQARGLNFPHVFILGLNQGVFPRVDADHWLLGRIGRDVGLDIATSDQVLQQQHIFFHNCVAMADETLTLSRQLPGETQVEVSTFWREMAGLVQGGMPEKTRDSGDLLAPLEEQEVCSLRRLTERVIYDGSRHKESPLLRAAADIVRDEPDIDSLLTGINFERKRYSSQPPGNEDGVLAAEANLNKLKRRFSPAIYSISRLEQYASCPFKFFAAAVLQLDPTPLQKEEFGPLERGSFLHWLLEQFYRLHLDACREQPGTIWETLERLAGQWLSKKGWPLSLVWRLRIADAVDMVSELIERDLAWQQDTGLRPLQLEAEFGGSDFPGGPVAVAGSTVRFHGFIDRIDVMHKDGHNWVVVYDYKTSAGVTWSSISQGLSLQIPVYMAAADGLVAEAGCSPARVVGGGYYSIKNAAISGGVWHEDFVRQTKIRNASLNEEQWQEMFRGIAKASDGYHAGIMAGRFPPRPAGGACRNCQFRQCCRYDKHRMLLKEGSEDDAT